MQGALMSAASTPTIEAALRSQPPGRTEGISSSSSSLHTQLGAKFSSLNGSALVKPAQSEMITVDPCAWAVSGVRSLWDSLTKNVSKKNTVTLKGKVSLSKKNILDAVNVGSDLLDTAFDLLNKKVSFQLVSVDLDPSTKSPKLSATANLGHWTLGGIADTIVSGEETFSVDFEVPEDFGEVGAFKIFNNHPNEFYLHSLMLTLPNNTVLEFFCKSWIFNVSKYKKDRVIFSNKNYLPSDTPAGLKALRESELVVLRGDGTGERQVWDRVYDYDIYNDLGNPALIPSTKRPPLGGNQQLPYPRRIRTGRAKSKADPQSESITLGGSFYIPPDEKFSQEKNSGFLAEALKSVGHGITPLLQAFFDETPNEWDTYAEVINIYKTGIDLSACAKEHADIVNKESPFVFLNTIFAAQGEDEAGLKFPTPQVIQADKKAWIKDEEFGRETLASLNPVVISLVKEFPPKSSLDPSQYGQGTALTNKHIEPYLEGNTVAQAIQGKRLFTIDYHDILLPYIAKLNAGKTNKGYAPRAFFYHTNDGKMMPVAIELSLPPTTKGGDANNRVFTPTPAGQATDYIWELAKLHFRSMDFAFHEVYTHFVRAHACMEPFIIAANRQLSRLHPMYTYLLPLFKNTMNINAAAREALINANGIIELAFTTSQYSMEISSVIYGAIWRFDQQALPADLVARGMAEPADPAQYPGGVKLVVEDYPFAKDGLEVWDAVKSYASKYVNIVYTSDDAVKSDTELQSWWSEVINVGHGDKKNSAGWPKLDSKASLVDILTTISWTAGPHHAAVNFGQYSYAGFFPNNPSQTRRFIPVKGSKEYDELQANPEKFALSSVSLQTSATLVMVVIELLATHAVDEEYVGQRLVDYWTSDPKVKEAFAEYYSNLRAIEKIQENRNKDPKLINRSGPAKVPYTLLYPSSTSGLTGKGIPTSVSI